MSTLALALAVVIGVVVGMLGGGGAILTVPLLVYVLGLEPRAAIATSLFVIAVTSSVGAVVHARAGAVRWRGGAVFAAGAMAGAFAGGRVARFVPPSVLLGIFGCVMLVSALGMLRRRTAEPSEAGELRAGRMVVVGLGVGALSGMIGAGGGFLIVPALALLGGVPTRESIGTSLFVIALQSFAGFAGHVGDVAIDWSLVAGLTSTMTIGSVVGAIAGRRVSAARLRVAFAWLVIAMGVFMLSRQIPLVAAIALAVAVTVLAIVFSQRTSPK